MARVRSPSNEIAAVVDAAPAPRSRTGTARRKRVDAPAPSYAGSPRSWSQVVWIAGMAASGFLAVALGSYRADDASLSVVGTGKVENLAGPIGASVADLVYQGFGFGGWALVGVGLWCALRLAGRRVGGWFSTLLAAVGGVLVCSALQLCFGGLPDRPFAPGGVTGILVSDALVAQIGTIGTGLAVATGLVTVATVLFGINWQPIAARAVEKVQQGGPIAARGVGAVGAGALRVSARMGAAGVMALRERMASPQGEEADEENGEGTSGDLDAAIASTRPAPALLLEADPLPSVWSARAAPPAPKVVVGDPDRDAPTTVAARSLVEVEWEATNAGPVRRTMSPLAPTSPEPERKTVPPVIARDAPAVVMAAPAPSPVFVREMVPVELEDLEPPRAKVSAARVEPEEDDEPDPDDLSEPTPLPAPRAPRLRSSGAAVVPGNLQSGGAGDDGKAIRRTGTPYQLPPLSLLDDHPVIVAGTDEGVLHDMARRLTATLQEFDVVGRVTSIRPGPVITLFEYEPAPGIKLNKIEGLCDNLKMALKATSIRIIAPMPGRGCVGIEIPNERRQTIWARDVFASPEFTGTQRVLPMILGKDTEGRPYVTDLAKMPHLLICGTTGSGKSVGVNGMLCSLLYVRTPEELRLILIDPKMLEFGAYEDIPHLLHPVVTEAKLASSVLKWACNEMDERYRTMARWGTRNIDGYNEKVARETQDWTPEKARQYAPRDWPEGDLLPQPRKFPFIVIVIDELADLMSAAGKDVEESIQRIAQKARAAGIHLVIATQTPRRDVITGTIKANMPASLCYRVRNGLDSRVVLDQNGAETLLGNGDLLFLPPGSSDLVRIHGPFLKDDEVKHVAEFLRAQGVPEYDARITATAAADHDDVEIEHDEKWDEAISLAIERGKISTSTIQRELGIGYNRAAKIMEIMEREGIVGPADGVKPREVLVGR